MLWLKLNLRGQRVPYGFIEKAVQNGCEYLNLNNGRVDGGYGKKSEVPWRMKYLAIYSTKYHYCKEVLQNCCFLEKLAVAVVRPFP